MIDLIDVFPEPVSGIMMQKDEICEEDQIGPSAKLFSSSHQHLPVTFLLLLLRRKQIYSRTRKEQRTKRIFREDFDNFWTNPRKRRAGKLRKKIIDHHKWLQAPTNHANQKWIFLRISTPFSNWSTIITLTRRCLGCGLF